MAVFLANGLNAGAPSLAFANETNTGIYLPSAGHMDLVVKARRVASLDEDGNVGINVTNPIANLDIAARSGNVFRSRYNGGFSNWDLEDYGSSGYPSLNIRKGTGTFDSPTIIGNGFINARLRFWGYDGAKFVESGRIESAVGAAPALDTMPGTLTFATNNGSSLTPLNRFQITSDGYARLLSGTGGIQFNGDTASANALDDYEEGTWTPVFSDGTNDATMDFANGIYTKIGKFVHLQARMKASSLGSISGNIIIKGAPIYASSIVTSGGFTFAAGLNISAGTVLGLTKTPSSFVLGLQQWSLTTGTSTVPHTLLTNTAEIAFSITYTSI